MEVTTLTVVVVAVVLLLVAVGAFALTRGRTSLPLERERLPEETAKPGSRDVRPPEEDEDEEEPEGGEGDDEAPRPSHPPKAPEPPAPSSEGLFARLKAGLSKTQRQLAARIDDVFRGRKAIDDELLEELEMALISADMGVRTVSGLLEQLREAAGRDELKDADALRVRLKAAIRGVLESRDHRLVLDGPAPRVIMVVGVNGAGKTTTIGKLATRYRRQGQKVLLAAGDTFRAAAIEQLEVWGERAQVPVVRKEEGSDPSSVVFDALQQAVAEGYDLVIADTAGRLHTKTNLMDELKKIHRVIGKVVPGAPHETLLVLDATTGQNAMLQAKAFNEGVPLSGLVLTKLDGTAKGGIVVQVIGELGIPVKLIGIGEGVDDLRDFEPGPFVDALL